MEECGVFLFMEKIMLKLWSSMKIIDKILENPLDTTFDLESLVHATS